jgi:putative ABC transport system permease protein
MLRRELRSVGRRFVVYGGCMAIGIAVVVGMHSLGQAVSDAVDLRARELLGADLRLESRDGFGAAIATPLAEIERQALAPPTRVTRLGTMALAESSGRTRLVDLLAIEGVYPLYGEVWTEPEDHWQELHRVPGHVFVDSSLLLQLDLSIGERLRIGGESFEIAGAVRKAPGSFGVQVEVAPRIFMQQVDLDRTGLVTEGSLVAHLRYLKLPAGVVEPWLEAHGPALEAARVRVQTVAGYQEDLSEAFDSLTRYLGLVGLAALVLGAIGVAAGVRVLVAEKRDAVALLRSIGAGPLDVAVVYTGLALCLGLAAGALGTLVCVPLLGVFPILLAGWLPVEVELSLGPASVATGLGLGVGATLLCALGPIVDLAAVSPLRAIRRDYGGDARRASAGRLAIGALVVSSLFAASIWQASELRVGMGFAAGLLVVAGGLALAAWLAMRGLQRHPPRGMAFWARQGIANLSRPRNHTLPTVVAIGFALFVVATLHAVQRNVLVQLAIDSRPERPNLVVFDVQRDQLEAVRQMLMRHGATIPDHAPLIAARLAGVDGRARSDWLGDEGLSREMRWALEREYRLTYADALRESEEIVAGRWWRSDEVAVDDVPYPISLERDLARSLGVELGDRLRWQIQGVEVDTEITSLRQVDWGRMATNFFVVFPPAALEAAPQSTVLLAHLDGESARATLQGELVVAFPNVSALDATLILRSLDSMLEQVGIAIRILSLFTLGTGLTILLAASLAARAERARETLLLRVLGASRSTLRRILATEAIALAALAASVGAGMAALAAWAIVVLVFELPFAPPFVDLAWLTAATFFATAILAGIGVPIGGSRSPQAALRQGPP